VFEATNSVWRGIGLIPGSGLKIRKEFESFDAGKNIPVNIEESRENPGCICGFVLRGLKIPTECKLYGKICTPENPVGACMVSSEGTCAAYYKYVGI
ncbi:MAG: hydrogenase formation protein HypD, partial [Firmicutes bacterium]|nr:hydrogenase formation protein HypD [Bacillota bacterium]